MVNSGSACSLYLRTRPVHRTSHILLLNDLKMKMLKGLSLIALVMVISADARNLRPNGILFGCGSSIYSILFLNACIHSVCI